MARTRAYIPSTLEDRACILKWRKSWAAIQQPAVRMGRAAGGRVEIHADAQVAPIVPVPVPPSRARRSTRRSVAGTGSFRIGWARGPLPFARGRYGQVSAAVSHRTVRRREVTPDKDASRMVHVKSYRYVPKRWLMLVGLMLCLGATVGWVIVGIKTPVAPYVPLDILLMRRVAPVLFFAALSAFFMVPAYRSFLGTRLLLDRERLLIPKGASLHERIEVRYADIERLEVVKQALPGQYPEYLVYLVIDHRVGAMTRQCSLSRSFFRSRGTFRQMCTLLADNVRQANPAITGDPQAIRLVPHWR